MSSIVHLMGPSCAGKSTLINRVLAIAPENACAVEVGKMLRAKYGEAYFKGQAAPANTQTEAWEMYLEGVNAGIAQRKKLILVDGQPRDARQAIDSIGLWRAPHRASYLLLHADHEERDRRCRQDNGDRDLEARLQRLTNDYRNCYTVLAHLLMGDQVVRVIDTTRMVDPDALAEQILVEYQ
jgi:adenylate kinase family enzyme